MNVLDLLRSAFAGLGQMQDEDQGNPIMDVLRRVPPGGAPSPGVKSAAERTLLREARAQAVARDRDWRLAARRGMSPARMMEAFGGAGGGGGNPMGWMAMGGLPFAEMMGNYTLQSAKAKKEAEHNQTLLAMNFLNNQRSMANQESESAWRRDVARQDSQSKGVEQLVGLLAQRANIPQEAFTYALNSITSRLPNVPTASSGTAGMPSFNPLLAALGQNAKPTDYLSNAMVKHREKILSDDAFRSQLLNELYDKGVTPGMIGTQLREASPRMRGWWKHSQGLLGKWFGSGEAEANRQASLDPLAALFFSSTGGKGDDWKAQLTAANPRMF